MIMEKILVLFVCTIVSLACDAQYYNPYAPSYQQQQQMNQRAFEFGKKMYEQVQEQNEKQMRNNPLMMSGVAVSEMASGQYEKAYEHFEYLAENYDDSNSWLYLGYMNELGMGTSKSYNYAKLCYANGAELGNQNCKTELNRIKRGNYLGGEYKAIFRRYFQDIVSQTRQSAGSIDFGTNSSSSSRRSSSSSKSGGVQYIESIEYAPEFTGQTTNVWCERCKKYMPRHAHVKRPVR